MIGILPDTLASKTHRGVKTEAKVTLARGTYWASLEKYRRASVMQVLPPPLGNR